jgi:hypothetical protein
VFHQQAADELGCDDLGGAGEEGLEEVLGEPSRCVAQLINMAGSRVPVLPPLPAKLTPLHFDHQGGLMEQGYASLQRGR